MQRCRLGILILALVVLPVPHAIGPSVPARPNAVSFRDTVAPILVKKCLGCHGDRKASGGLNMATFASLKRGGKVAGDTILDAGRSRRELSARIDRSGWIAAHAVQAAAPFRRRDRGRDAVGEGRGEISTVHLPRRHRWSLSRRAGRSAQDRFEGSGRRPDCLGWRSARTVGYSPPRLDARLCSMTWRRARSLATLGDHPGPVTSVRFTPDGTSLLAAGGRAGLFGSVTVWDVAKRQQRFEGKGHC